MHSEMLLSDGILAHVAETELVYVKVCQEKQQRSVLCFCCINWDDIHT